MTTKRHKTLQTGKRITKRETENNYKERQDDFNVMINNYREMQRVSLCLLAHSLQTSG